MAEKIVVNERKTRIEKLNYIRQELNPYPSHSKRSHSCQQAIEKFDQLSRKLKPIWLAGRLRLLREHGAITFAQLEDQSARIQLLFKKDIVGEKKYKFLKVLDIGDFLQVAGVLIKTKTGEITLQVQDFELLAKSLRPLPEKWHGLKDVEERFRRRYVDLIVNPEVRKIFAKRTQFIKEIRSYLDKKGFMEVETPVLESVTGGAEANPFVTHHQALDIDLYLRIALELHHKRLVVGGLEKIYEIGKVFRNEGISPMHLQELSMLEFYMAYSDYQEMMNFVEDFYSAVISQTFGTLQFDYQGRRLDFTPPWPRIDYYQMIQEKAGIDLSEIQDVEQLIKEIKRKKINIEFEKYAGLGRVIDQLYKKVARPQIIQPSFLIDHPVTVSPLAKRKPDDPSRVERMQVLFMGAEVGNGFSELNDPLDQRKRFEEQQKLREAGDIEAQMFDEDFVEALEYGMPPTAGFGVGIDRWLMYLVDAANIRETVFFPLLRPK